MCTEIFHGYICGHGVKELARCATSRSANCGRTARKSVKHDERCDNCDAQQEEVEASSEKVEEKGDFVNDWFNQVCAFFLTHLAPCIC